MSGIRVVVANTVREAHDYCSEQGINPRRVTVVTPDPYTVARLRGMSLTDAEVVSILRPHAFTDQQARNCARMMDEVERAKRRGR